MTDGRGELQGTSDLADALKQQVRAVCERLESTWDEEHPEPSRDSLPRMTSATHQALLAELNLGNGDPASGNNGSGNLWLESGAVAERFEIVRPLASGGMGMVSEAIDREFDRPVALKEILPAGANDPAYRLRFQTEAEITARLDHPGVIPVYSRGKLPDGRLFYTMRLISGEKTGTLQKAIKAFHHTPGEGAKLPISPAQDLAWRGLIRRVIDVCNTMAYAHSQGVLHRDLKPSNILLGPCGETLVVDWGLARFVHDSPEMQLEGLSAGSTDSLTTQVTVGVGTMGHAAPEQLLGDGMVASEASDIYSLGTILYAVLTGHTPFPAKSAGDPNELVKRICASAFPPPRQVNPRIDPALQAICLKAMSRDPSRRYHRAGDLAIDLERALAGEPVSAWSEPWTRRVRRWVASRRTLVATGAVGLVMLTLALGGISAQQSWNRLELQREANKLAGALKDAQAERDKADLAQQQAEQERQNAARNEALAVQAVARFHEAVARSEELRNDPRLNELREQLLREPLPFFQELRNRLLDDQQPSLANLARLRDATLDLARFHREVGDTGEAVALCRNMVELCTHVLETPATLDEGESRQWRSARAHVRLVLGTILPPNEHRDECLQNYEASIAEYEELLPLGNNDEQVRWSGEMANARMRAAIILTNLGRLTEAHQSFERALELQQSRLDHQPESPDYRRELAELRENFALTLEAEGADEAAGEQRQLAETLYASQDPKLQNSARFLVRQATNHLNRGVALTRRSQDPQALDEYRKAESLFRRLCELFPGVNEYEDSLRYTQLNVIAALQKLEQPAETLTVFRELIERLRSTVEKSPSVSKFRGTLVEMLHNEGHLLLNLNQGPEARKVFAEALEQVGILTRDMPFDGYWRSQDVDLRIHLSNFDMEEGALESARDRLLAAMSPAQALAESNQSSSMVRQLYRNLVTMLGSIHERLGETPAAERYWQELRTSLKNDPDQQQLMERVKEILQGVEPETTAECLDPAKKAFDFRESKLSERLFRLAFEREPALLADRQQQLGFQAARAALYEASKESSPESEAAMVLRRRALAWLQAELQGWQESAQQNPQVAGKVVRSWTRDPVLAAALRPEFLATLPADEQTAWNDLVALAKRLIALAP